MNVWEKVKDEVKKTGLPLEVEVLQTLLKKDWQSEPSISYSDDEIGQYRELDNRATKYWKIETRESAIPYQLVLTLIIECKRSEKDVWVFYPIQTERYFSIDIMDTFGVIRKQALSVGDSLSFRHHRFLGLDKSLFTQAPLVTESTARQIKWLTEEIPLGLDDLPTLTSSNKSMTGTSVRFGKADKGPNLLYDASMKVTKAHTSTRETMSSMLFESCHLYRLGYEFKRNGIGPIQIIIFHPIIVYDGLLGLWNMDNDMPDAMKHVLYRFSPRTPHYASGFPISVVHRTHFSDLIKQLESDMFALRKKIQSKKKLLDHMVSLVTGFPKFSDLQDGGRNEGSQE